MSKNSIISIRNGVIASVVAGLILALIPTLRGYAVAVLRWFRAGIESAWLLLVDSHSSPGWVWAIVGGLAIIGLGTLLKALWLSFKRAPHLDYIEDTIHGATWRWQWWSNKIVGLWGFCPTCDGTLVYNENQAYHQGGISPQTDFICENCNDRLISSIKGGYKSYALGVIEREIERRVRTDEYQSKV